MPTNSTRPPACTRATVNVRSSPPRPGITSARNVSRAPAAKWAWPAACRFLPARERRALLLSTRMNEAAHTVGEEHVYLLRLDHRRHFAVPEDRMRQRLPGAIRARAVVRCSSARGGACTRPAASLERTARAALRTTHARDAAELCDRD